MHSVSDLEHRLENLEKTEASPISLESIFIILLFRWRVPRMPGMWILPLTWHEDLSLFLAIEGKTMGNCWVLNDAVILQYRKNIWWNLCECPCFEEPLRCVLSSSLIVTSYAISQHSLTFEYFCSSEWVFSIKLTAFLLWLCQEGMIPLNSFLLSCRNAIYKEYRH